MQCCLPQPCWRKARWRGSTSPGVAGQPPAGRAAWLFWVAQAAAILIKGPIIPLLSLLTVGTPRRRRPRPKLAARIETAARHCARRAARLALGRRHLAEIRLGVLAGIGRQGHAGQGRLRPGIAWLPARVLFADLFTVRMAVRRARHRRRAGGADPLALRSAAGLPACLVPALLDRLRVAADQAAALRAAGLSGAASAHGLVFDRASARWACRHAGRCGSDMLRASASSS